MKDIREILNTGENKVLMSVFPHPDDETMAAGGLLLAAKAGGWKTVVVSMTAGGAGRIHIHPNGKSLVEMRREELKRAAGILRADEVVVAEFDDGKLKQQRRRMAKWLGGLVNKHRPELV